MKPLRVFIGFDPRQVVSYQLAAFSVVSHATVPVSVTPLILEQLPINRQGLTPFTWSRFLVPWLCNYVGTALFLDADVLVRGDVKELFDRMDDHAVMVGDVVPFERASVMLFNCGHEDNAVLDPDYIENTDGS